MLLMNHREFQKIVFKDTCRLILKHRMLSAATLFAVVCGIALLLITSDSRFSLTALTANQNADSLAQSKKNDKSANFSKDSQIAQNASKPSSNTKSTIQTPQNGTTTNSNQSVIKYSVSPDPRSTAYSLTPPKPNPASFEYQVTHAGQFSPGTLIDYNATKQDKTYYGGDLVISEPTITWYRQQQGLYTDWFKVSTPDGSVANQPNTPWYQSYQGYGVQASNDASPLASSWYMDIVMSSSLSPGTYTVHIMSTRAPDGYNTYEYDGFITLRILN